MTTTQQATAFGELLQASNALSASIESGELFAGYDGDTAQREKAVATIERFEAARLSANEAADAIADAAIASPFARYRAEIKGGYSTALRLSSLVLHLYNGNQWTLDLPTFLTNADERHVAIALELLDSYAKHGENDPDFMDLAREILRRDHPELFE